MTASYYKLSADQGHVRAQFNMGVIYHNGYGVDKDSKRAAYYFELFANHGNIKSREQLELINKEKNNPDDKENVALSQQQVTLFANKPKNTIASRPAKRSSHLCNIL